MAVGGPSPSSTSTTTKIRTCSSGTSIRVRTGSRAPNRLFLNDRDERFIDVSAAYGFSPEEERGTTCLQAVDYDGDGWQDILICEKAALKVYRNENGLRFVDVTESLGITGKASDASFVDMNGDSLRDLVHVQLSL